MRVKVILNPYANRWRAREQAPATEAAFRAAGVAWKKTKEKRKEKLTQVRRP